MDANRAFEILGCRTLEEKRDYREHARKNLDKLKPVEAEEDFQRTLEACRFLDSLYKDDYRSEDLKSDNSTYQQKHPGEEKDREEERIRNWIRKNSKEQGRIEKTLIAISAFIVIFSIISFILTVPELLRRRKKKINGDYKSFVEENIDIIYLVTLWLSI